MTFFEAVKNRRSIYTIGKGSPVAKEEIIGIVKDAVKHVPSAFNMQSARAVVLFGEHHDKLWSIVLETLRKIVPAEKFAPTEEKVGSFACGYGTVLFFDDTKVTDAFGEQFSLYKDNFKLWAQHSNGMLQHIVWTALGEKGLGASLQHYNPLIDDEVKASFSIPQSWQLIAQMPFGEKTAPAGPKEFEDIDKRVKVFE